MVLFQQPTPFPYINNYGDLLNLENVIRIFLHSVYIDMYIYFIHKRGCFPWDFASILFSPPITLWYSSVFHDRLTANLTIWQL